ncbi:MAG: 16S rRNA (cytosine(1402)-N(4))-methyltransferase RsmH [Candidatus Omnitrophica bacterium]|nr:16S rRNA (cytosine(1402)-N(4))-methyltransferase RsmH [Candidatus Omnitrophota bacterium]
MHRPVMLDEVLGFLDLRPGDTVLDATLGGGGHSKEILKRITPGGMLLGCDADPAAIDRARENLRDFTGSFKLANGNFRYLNEMFDHEGLEKIDAALFDIGISSYQMDEGARGFSIKNPGPLDMRMDPRLKVSAKDLVNRLREEELSDIIKDLGEERFYRRIARAIVERRREKKIETTEDLASVVYRAVGGRYKRGRLDPATRTFQAIRIAVNDELGALKDGLGQIVTRLNAGGRMAVISFHSLEDRIVKNKFKEYSAEGLIKILTKKPVRPTDAEVAENPRSRSGRLRVAERI